MTALQLERTNDFDGSTEVAALMSEQPRFFDSIDLVALPSAITVTRLFIGSTLHRWNAGFIEPEAQLVAGELVKHAVEGSKVPTDWQQADRLDYVVVRLLGYERSIVLQVWDTITDPAEPSDEDQGADQSDMELVEAHAKRWGLRMHRGGRMAWAELDMYTKAGLPRRPKLRPNPRPSSTLEQTIHDLDLLRRVRDGIERL